MRSNYRTPVRDRHRLVTQASRRAGPAVAKGTQSRRSARRAACRISIWVRSGVRDRLAQRPVAPVPADRCGVVPTHEDPDASRIRSPRKSEPLPMLGFLRPDPRKKLQLEYERLLREARDLQRNGDILGYAEITARAEEVARQIDEANQRR